MVRKAGAPVDRSIAKFEREQEVLHFYKVITKRKPEKPI